MTNSQKLESICKKPLRECSNEDIYISLVKLINEKKKERKPLNSKKKLYYISAEFLIGKLLVSNLINLGIYDEIKAFLEENGKSIDEIEELEQEPSLGNGGLGRLAACFLDSIASLNLNGDGIGLLYHFGLFKQVFKKNLQTEEINPWIEKDGFLNKNDISYKVSFKDFDVTSRLYDIDIIGDKTKVNKLHLFDIESVDEKIINDGINYDKKDVQKNLTLFLYPDDSDDDGKKLRIYQQYFMVSNAARLIIKECKEKGSNLYDLYDYAVIQINDTHPSLIIPEMIYLLCDEGIYIDDAIKIVSKMCAYTNHTILSEALEKWPMEFFKNTIPHIVPIIEILDNKIRRKFNDKRVYIIDDNEYIHMAHIAIHYSFSVNGVAYLHTKILKESELNHFYTIYPQKFNNKTNGITFRRWLIESNGPLYKFITTFLGEDIKNDWSKLNKLMEYKEHKDVLFMLSEIKHQNKLRLKKYIYDTQNIEINENSVFDIQIKRLHEYKRQQLNILYYINKYLEIKSGILPKRPMTAIFGAKAAGAYTIAKDIIHLILCMQNLIKNDNEVSKHLNIVMVENYNVTSAQYLIPACDISEQISLASKEASGTGNMKLMLNGAITLGTLDGANVEIKNLVGDDNIYIFGFDSDTVIKRYKENSYNPKEYYEKVPTIKKAVDFITSDEMLKVGHKENLERLKNELITKDYFMTFPDFLSYTETKEKMLSDYENRLEWSMKMLVNIANAGYFSSDRTIEEYNKDIWHI